MEPNETEVKLSRRQRRMLASFDRRAANGNKAAAVVALALRKQWGLVLPGVKLSDTRY